MKRKLYAVACGVAVVTHLALMGWSLYLLNHEDYGGLFSAPVVGCAGFIAIFVFFFMAKARGVDFSRLFSEPKVIRVEVNDEAEGVGYIHFQESCEGISKQQVEVGDSLVLDFDDCGVLVGIEVLDPKLAREIKGSHQ